MGVQTLYGERNGFYDGLSTAHTWSRVSTPSTSSHVGSDSDSDSDNSRARDRDRGRGCVVLVPVRASADVDYEPISRLPRYASV